MNSTINLLDLTDVYNTENSITRIHIPFKWDGTFKIYAKS